MPHRIVPLRKDGYVDGLHAGTIWLREGRSPAALVAADPETGAERGRIELPDDRFFGPRFFCGEQTILAMVSGAAHIHSPETLQRRKILEDTKIIAVTAKGTRALVTGRSNQTVTALALPSLEEVATRELGGYSSRYDRIGAVCGDVL